MPRPVPSTRPPHGGQTASEFSQQVLYRSVLEGYVGIHLFQPVVFVLKLLYPLEIRGLSAAALRLPLIKAGCADPMLSADVLNLATVLTLFEDRNNLALAESGLSHRHFLHHMRSMMAEVSNYDLSVIRGSLQQH